MTFVWGSSPSAVSRSTSERSALLPMLTSLARPKPRPAAWSRIAVHSAPDCEKIEMLAGARHAPGERGVHPVAGVDQPEAVRAEQPHALGGAEAGDLRLELGALAAGLAKAGGDDRRSPWSRRGGSPGPPGSTAAAGTAMTPRSIAPARRLERGEAGQVEDRRRGRVHRHDPAGEAAGDQVGEDVVPDLARGAGGADDGDRSRGSAARRGVMTGGAPRLRCTASSPAARSASCTAWML